MSKRENKNDWAIGGGLIVGLGAGLFFLKQSPLAFVACLLIGLGVGLIITSFLSREK